MFSAKQTAIRDMKQARCEYVLYLREQGMTYRAIAKRLGVSPENVRQRINCALRARKQTALDLKKILPAVYAITEQLENLNKGADHGNT